MRTLDFFTEWTYTAAAILDAISNLFPCFVNLTDVEMNWKEISIQARQEDMPTIEKMVAEIV